MENLYFKEGNEVGIFFHKDEEKSIPIKTITSKVDGVIYVNEISLNDTISIQNALLLINEVMIAKIPLDTAVFATPGNQINIQLNILENLEKMRYEITDYETDKKLLGTTSVYFDENDSNFAYIVIYFNNDKTEPIYSKETGFQVIRDLYEEEMIDIVKKQHLENDLEKIEDLPETEDDIHP
ncbi:MAG: hypothetical protein ACI9AR_000478 [Flavobacteriaceae bacterium]|jgi:uncharacterized protein YlbG (UPF0298 family)